MSFYYADNKKIKVAGVTFPNNDGESRQEILKQIGFGFKTAILKQTTFEGERAVEVWIDGKQVGYIPRKELNDPMSYFTELTAQIMYFEREDIIFVELSYNANGDPKMSAC